MTSRRDFIAALPAFGTALAMGEAQTAVKPTIGSLRQPGSRWSTTGSFVLTQRLPAIRMLLSQALSIGRV